jgi:hypothetical protein
MVAAPVARRVLRRETNHEAGRLEADPADDAPVERRSLQPRRRSIGKSNLAADHPDKVVAMQKRLDTLARESAKALFLVDQFKVVMKNMNGEPVLPTDEDFADVQEP